MTSCGHRLVVRTSRCGRENVGSIPADHNPFLLYFFHVAARYIFIFNDYENEPAGNLNQVWSMARIYSTTNLETHQ